MSNADWRSDRIGAALAGTNPTVLCRMASGFAAIGDVQFLPGYCVLLVDDPEVHRLSDLPRPRRSAYLHDLDLLAEAVETVCSIRDPAFTRVNIEILGNKDPFLHAHIWPRYTWEPPHLRQKPVWLYPSSYWTQTTHQLAPPHDDLRTALAARIAALSFTYDLHPLQDASSLPPAKPSQRITPDFVSRETPPEQPQTRRRQACE